MNYETALIELKSQHLYRALRPVKKEGKFLYLNGEKYLNLSSNDYLGIAADEKIRAEFIFNHFNNAGFCACQCTELSSTTIW